VNVRHRYRGSIDWILLQGNFANMTAIYTVETGWQYCCNVCATTNSCRSFSFYNPTGSCRLMSMADGPCPESTGCVPPFGGDDLLYDYGEPPG